MSDELLLTLGSVLSLGKGAIDMSDELLLTLGSVMSRSSRRTAPWSSPFALEI